MASRRPFCPRLVPLTGSAGRGEVPATVGDTLTKRAATSVCVCAGVCVCPSVCVLRERAQEAFYPERRQQQRQQRRLSAVLCCLQLPRLLSDGPVRRRCNRCRCGRLAEDKLLGSADWDTTVAAALLQWDPRNPGSTVTDVGGVTRTTCWTRTKVFLQTRTPQLQSWWEPEKKKKKTKTKKKPTARVADLF